MRALIIDNSVRTDAARVVAFAEENPVDAARLERVLLGQERPPGSDERHGMSVPHNFRVVFSVDELPNGLARHFSMSIPEPGRLPNPEAIRMMLPLFGMAEFEMCVVWVEGDPRGLGAINLLCGDGRASGEAGVFAPLTAESDGVRNERFCPVCRRRFAVGDHTGAFRAGNGMPGGNGVDLAIAHHHCLRPTQAGAMPKEVL